MRRDRALKRGRWLSLLVAGFIGYLLGDWHAIVARSATDLSASQNVALRFPEPKAAAAADAVPDMPVGATSTAANTLTTGDTQVALLNPDPMVPVRRQAMPAAMSATMPVPVHAAAAPEQPAPSVPENAAARRAAPLHPKAETKAEAKSEPKPVAALPPKAEMRMASAEAARATNRQGFVLNDVQIASIKTRLHLSPDQQEMWPAVEAALRNIAYVKAHEQHRRNGANSELASLDPDSAEVQGLKSAAVPLIMSFSEEQRSEVRNLAHVMGLDQLATQF